MKCLIVGCSITHGSELVSDTYHPDNVHNTYANKLSEYLGVDPNNIAIPGNSNEAIFHSAVENLSGHSVLIVGWTSLFRDSWISNKQQYFFNTHWGCVTNDLTMSDVYVNIKNQVKFVSNNESMLTELQEYHRFLTLFKFDSIELTKKVKHYRQCLKNLCTANGIKYIDVTLLGNLFKDTCFYDSVAICRGSHPNEQQHIDIMNLILKHYNL